MPRRRRGASIVMAVKTLQERQDAAKREHEANNPVVAQPTLNIPLDRREPGRITHPKPALTAEQIAERKAKHAAGMERARKARQLKLEAAAEEARELEERRSAARRAEEEALRLHAERTAASRIDPEPISMPQVLRDPLVAPPYEPGPALMPAPDFYPGAEGELQQTPLFTLSDSQTGLGYETNMAAFEAQDPSGRHPTTSNVGYSSVKAGFRR